MKRKNNTKAWEKRLAVLLAVIFLICSAAGCGTAGEGVSSGESGAKGRYVETAFGLPKDSLPVALGETGGKLRLLCDNGAYESADGGETWEKLKLESASFQKFSGEGKISQGSWGAGGELIFAAYDPEDGEGKTRYYILDKTGKERELPLSLPELDWGEEELGFSAGEAGNPAAEEAEEQDAVEFSEEGFLLENSFTEFGFLPDGSVIGRDQEGVIYQIDQNTGEFLHTIAPSPEIAYYDGFAVTGDTLAAYYSLGGGGAELYDLGTWQRKEADEALNSFLAGGREKGANASGVNQSAEGGTTTVDSVFVYSSSNGGGISLGGGLKVFAKDGEDALYFCGSGGVYRHVSGGASIEQVINGAMSSLTNPSFHVQDMLKTEAGSFKALCWEESSGQGDYSLMSYDFDPEISAVPETELRAYTLYDSAELRQFIAMYQKANPNVYINLEVALENSGALTESDALRALNANIMAGKGPDLLFLDGMPVENYMEKGLLADLSDVLEKARKEDLLENIVSACQRDGKTYALPGRFTMPVLVGEKSKVSSAAGLSALAQTVEDLRKAGPEQQGITGQRPYSLLDRLFVASAPAWFQEDGALSREKLEDFFQQCQRIYQAERKGRVLKEEEIADGFSFTVSSFGASLLGVDLLSGNAQILLETLDSAEGFSCFVSVKDKMEDIALAPLNGQCANVFTPKALVGVSAKSGQTEKAKEFVRFMLSEKGQEHSQGTGLPVNREALEVLLQGKNLVNGGIAVMSNDGSYNMELSLRTPTQDEVSQLLDLVSALDTPAFQNQIIHDAVMEQGTTFLLEEKSLQEAVDEVLKQVSLYLSEA